MPYRAITSANSVRGTGYIGAVLAVDGTSTPAVRVSDCAVNCVGACKQPIAARRTTAEANRVFITGLRIACCKQDRRLVLDIPVPALTVPTPANRCDSAAILLAQQAEWPDPAQPPRPGGLSCPQRR